ncbi:MAG: hypothetical protein ACYC61_08135 [Isosphaeraceae bacterium]
MTATFSLAEVSFRDPAGFVYTEDGEVRRQVNHAYREHYDRLMTSGLYDQLVAERLLIPHEEISAEGREPSLAYRVIRPEPIGLISYPYEWSFSALRDAALAALAVQRRALERGMTLKDGSAYNLQFHRGRPVFIDTLSFEVHREGALVAAAAVVPVYTVDRLIGPAGWVLGALNGLWVRRGPIVLNPIWIVLLELVLLVGFALFVRRLGDLSRPTRFLNVLAVVVVALPISRIATVKAPAASRPARQAHLLASAPSSQVARRPDITPARKSVRLSA